MHNSVDAELRDRAQRVIPNGMWGHMNVARIPAAYPQYFARAEGCHLWDVDGREYVDFMCAYGPMLLGYNDADVNRAADAQRAQGDIFNGPSARLVELAELMVETVAHAGWAMFQKNGSDATTTCAMIAREATGKRKVLVANGAYHGAVPWCNPYPNGATAEDRVHLIRYDFNDVASIERAAMEAGNDLAGVFVSAFKHDLGKTHEAPTAAFAQAARRICDKAGAALIVDDVRAGFRLHLAGSGEAFGVQPDLACYSKAIANGYPLSACLGRDALRDAAKRVFFVGTYWTAAVPMAAALACLAELERSDAIEHMDRMGTVLRVGMERQAAAHGLAVRSSGPPAIPFMTFAGDEGFAESRRFAAACAAHGVYLHPHHNWFLSAAHGEGEIGRVLEATEAAFREVAEAR